MRSWRFLTACLVVLTLCRFSLADGLIIIHNPPQPVPGHFAFAPLEVSFHHVNVTIENNVATTSVDQEFYNPNSQRLEGTYMFPLPSGGAIDKFSMDIDGKMMDAELLPADKAKSIYEDIVRRQRDPALLEYVGRDAFKVRIFPIEPNSRKRVKLQYSQLLKTDNGLTEYVYPLNTEKFSAKPLRTVSVKVDLKATTPIKNIYCPSHKTDIRRSGADGAVIGYEDRNVRPDTDFKLIWSQDKDPVGLNLLTWQTGSDDGYFLLMASPGMDVDRKMVQAKDICFVIDTSGSMAGPKMEQAKKALRFCLANLNAEDRFEIIRFSTESERLFNTLVPADKANLDKADAFVAAMKPIGGTAIQDAMDNAMRTFALKSIRPMLAPGTVTPEQEQHAERLRTRPSVIIFLTDGQPTIGETNVDKLVDSATRDAGSVKIFPFGIGSDINTHLLDRLADKTHAVSQYVLPSEDIEIKVSGFFTKIKEPVLSKLELRFGGDIKTSQIYPRELPDLYKGDTLTVFGRYSGSGPSAIRLRGVLNGEAKDFSNDVTFNKETVKHGFIPRLWATRRVGWLLDEIRLHGESKELKDEIVRLARDHGIVTPYTSYLILEDEQRRNVPVTLRTMSELQSDRVASEAARDAYDSARKDSERLEVVGERAVENSVAANSLKEGKYEQQAIQEYGLSKSSPGGGKVPAAVSVSGVVTTPTTQPSGYKIAQNYAQQARVVNGRAFYQNGTTWTDAKAQTVPNLKQQTIKFNSEEYYALILKHPDVAQWLSLGNEVDVVVEDTLVSVR